MSYNSGQYINDKYSRKVAMSMILKHKGLRYFQNLFNIQSMTRCDLTHSGTQLQKGFGDWQHLFNLNPGLNQMIKSKIVSNAWLNIFRLNILLVELLYLFNRIFMKWNSKDWLLEN